ncbi:MAG: MFS transporter [Candidatus Heimdallarchaeota archaeon]
MSADLVPTAVVSRKQDFFIPLRRLMPITSIGTYMSAMDGSIVNVSLVTISNSLNTDISGIRWVVIVYLLTISSIIGIGGSLGDNYGRRKILQIGMLIFVFGSLLCAFAPSLEILILSRTIQAIGGAGLTANGLGLVITYTEPSIRGRAIGINSVIVAFALSTGPMLGGVLTQYVGWPSIFLINVPIGIIGILLVQFFIPETTEKRSRLDYMGMITFLIAVFAVVQGILTIFNGELVGSVFILISAIFGASFIYIESKHPTPMVSVDILRDRTILTGVISSFLCYMVYYTVIFLLPFYYQDVLDFTQSEAGILMVVPPLAMAIMGPFAGFFAEKVEARRSTTIGAIFLSFFVMCLSILLNVFPINLLEILIILVPLVALSAGSLTTFTVSNGTSVMNKAPTTDVSVVSGLIGLSRNIGFALGTTLSSAFFGLFLIMNNAINNAGEIINISNYYVSLGQTYFVFSIFAILAALISYQRVSDISSSA